MKLPTYRRLMSTDFPKEFKSFVESMAITVNHGIEVLYNALNKNISLTDNIACSLRDVTVTVDSDGEPTGTTTMSLDSNNTVIGCQVIKVSNVTNPSAFPTGSVFITFAQNENGLTINHITGLIPNNKYTLKIVAYI